MKAAGLVGLGAMVFLASFASAEDKKADNAKLIVGKWEVTKADEGTVGVGAVVEFLKDGKMKVTGGDMMIEGTYKLAGDKVTISHKRDDQERSHDLNITKLDDTMLMGTDKDGK